MKVETVVDLQRLMQTDYPLSEQQWAAVTAPLRPTVVIAGAGSGKTTLMAARVVYLVATGQVAPDQVLGLTFTTKAAAELRRRIMTALDTAGLIGQQARESNMGEEFDVLEPTVATYNAYAADLVREHGLLIGHEPETRLLTDASRYQLGGRVIDRYRGNVEKLSDHPPTAIQNLLALDGAMAEHLVTAEQVLAADAVARRHFERAIVDEASGKNRSTYINKSVAAINAIDRRAELLGLVASYRRYKSDLGLMDFSDQIALGAQLVEAHPNVGAHERARFRVVLLDEYQDTSVAQARFLSALFSGPDVLHGRGHAVMAVGDPNQAIYGWRGASASNIVRFDEGFPAAEGAVETLPLTVNRRSERRIVQVANTLAQPLYDAMTTVKPLQVPPETGEGSVETHVFETQPEELAWVAEAIICDHDDGVDWKEIAILTRDNASAAACFDVLNTAGIPIEIVGLSGLIRLPEIADVVACLTLMQDPLANAALVTLLAGPRWSIGPRDLSMLSARARELARSHMPTALEGDVLMTIAEGQDPTEIAAIIDALEDPGDGEYSDRARGVFATVAVELKMLRRSVGEPLLDIVRRVIDTTGVDIELASSTSASAAARRENLDLFVKAVADFQSIDGDVSLAALLAYLTAEDEQGNGLDLAVPSQADSVKLLTIHRAKGLEWHSVYLVSAGATRFPSNRSRMLWVTSPQVLPAELRGDAADLPQLTGYDKKAIDAYRSATKAHEAVEELRLGYVAFTRAAKRLVYTSYVWGKRQQPYGPSEYQRVVRDVIAGWGEPVMWIDMPEKGTSNPTIGTAAEVIWPAPTIAEEARRRRDAAARIALVHRAAIAADFQDGLTAEQAAEVQRWDSDLEHLIAERWQEHAAHLDVPIPMTMSASAVVRWQANPEAFARDLARPMPRPPAPQARLGTRFHTWIESRFGQLNLIDPDELPGRADVGIDDEADLVELKNAFERGPFADRRPLAVEAPFSLVLAGQVIRGRIDAVFTDHRNPNGYLVVDWKTTRSETSDPIQLSLYRLAWAQLQDVDPALVRAGFYYVRSGRLDEPNLLDSAALVEALGTEAFDPGRGDEKGLSS